MTHPSLPLWSRRLVWITTLAMGLLPLLVVGVLLVYGPATLASLTTLPVSPQATGAQIAAALAVGVLPLAVLLWTLDHMRRLFRSLAAGAIFTPVTARHIRRSGQGFLALALSPLVVQPLQSVLLSWANPPGQRQVSVGLSSEMLGYALVSGLLIVIGWAMAQAAEIEAENRAFV